MFNAGIKNRTSGCLRAAAALTVLFAVVAHGQDATFDDWDRRGTQALRSAEFYVAVTYLRLALQRTEVDKISDAKLVPALANLAEALRSTRQYDEAEKLFARALSTL